MAGRPARRRGPGRSRRIRCEGEDTTYVDLLGELHRAQHALDQLGVSEGDRAALILNDDLAFPAWFLGSLRSGVVPIPLSTMLTGPELGTIIADAGAKLVVAHDVYATTIDAITDAAPSVTGVVICGDTGSEVHHHWSGFTNRSPYAAADTNVMSPAFWLYSSGTTGTPKGVMHVHGSVRATVETYATQVLEITENDRFLSVAKLFFAYGLGNSLTFPLAVGATTILSPQRPTPPSFLELIGAERPTLFFASPGFCAALLDASPRPETFASVRATVTAGESLPADVQTRFQALTGTPVCDGIGSTELLHIFISNTLTHQTPGSSGVPVPGYEVQLRSETDEVIDDIDTPGYLWVRGPSAAVGYHERPEVSAATFREGWVRTGDVYTRSSDGDWTFLGRNNDMIKAGGIWVSPAEVESALIEHPDVLEVAVVGARNDTGLEEVVAFVVPATGATPDPAQLELHCRERMAAFKRPRRILVVDDLPKTATGKIQRYALRERLG
ncbi:MAG: benzoate-CoA ligase family protein [Acidimicrobiales bacterium]